MIRTYIASPLFTPADNATLDRVESILSTLKFPYFSPRKGEKSVSFGQCKTREEKSKLASGVYMENVTNIMSAELMIVNVDSTTFMDPNSRSTDVGTAWEMGFQQARRVLCEQNPNSNRPKPLTISFSSKGFGMNIMLQFSSDCHLPSLDKLEEFLTRWKSGESYDDLCRSMSMLDGEVY